MFAPVGVRRRKKLSGTSGERERFSMQRKGAMSTAEAARTPIVWAEPQPTFVVWVSAVDEEHQAAVTVTAPAVSKWRASPSTRLSRTKRGTRTSGDRPIGTLTKKIHSQPAYSVSTPPRSTPIAAPEPAMRAQDAERLVALGALLEGDRADREDRGREDRAGGALQRRAAISIPADVGSPPAARRAKSAEADHEDLRRPSRSPARPPSSRNPPKVSA